MKEHPLVEIKAKTIDFSDIMADPIAKFNWDYYYYIYVIFGIIAPTMTNHLVCGETLFNSFIIGYVMRTITVTHDTALVNSAAHMFGDKPYNNKIQSTENVWVTLAAAGEGRPLIMSVTATNYTMHRLPQLSSRVSVGLRRRRARQQVEFGQVVHRCRIAARPDVQPEAG